MSRLVRGLVFTFAAVIGFGAASRAKDMTLDDCIELALKNRASIIAARGSAELAKAGERSALGAFLPHASASWNTLKTENRSWHSKAIYGTPSGDTTIEGDAANSNSTSTGMDIGATWKFTLPDAIFNYKISRLDRFGRQLDVIGSEQDLILAVKQSFYLYLAALQNQTVSAEAVKRSAEQLKLIQSRYELGSAALSDVLKQKVQYGNDQLGLLQANNLMITDKASLAYTIGLDPQQEQTFSTEYTVRQYDGTLSDAVKFGLEHKPSLLSQQKSVESSKLGLLSAKSDYLPKIGPTASYGYSWNKSTPTADYIYYTLDTTTRPPDTIMVKHDLTGKNLTTHGTQLTYGIGLTWNLFDGFAREERVTSAKIARNNAMAAFADQRNQVVMEIKTAFLNIEQLKEQKNVSQANVDASTEDLKITQEKYNLGAATILDLLNAQVSLRQAQVSLIQADFDLNVAVSKLENAMGKM
jgi:outer membrane protein